MTPKRAAKQTSAHSGYEEKGLCTHNEAQQRICNLTVASARSRVPKMSLSRWDRSDTFLPVL